METRSGIIGLAVGEAIGLPINSIDRSILVRNLVTVMLDNGASNMPKGTFSMATSMTLATIDSIIETQGILVEGIAQNFLQIINEGKYTAAGVSVNVGKTTYNALKKYGTEKCIADEAGGIDFSDNGNGALKRMLPVIYYSYVNKLNYSQILQLITKVSSITHGHQISIIGEYIYVIFGMCILEGKSKEEAYEYIQSLDYSMFSKECLKPYDRIINKNLPKGFKLSEINSTGYIVDTLEAIFWVLLNTNNFNQAIIGAINLGGATDSIGACIGGIAGMIYGIDTISNDWKIALRRYDYIVDLCEQFDDALYDMCNISEKLASKVISPDTDSLKRVKIIKESLFSARTDAIVSKKSNIELDYGKIKIMEINQVRFKYLIECNVPDFMEENKINKEKMLSHIYDKILLMAKDFRMKTIAIPILGVEFDNFPVGLAVKIAVDSVRKYYSELSINDEFLRVYLLCHDGTIYNEAKEYFTAVANVSDYDFYM